MDGTQSSFIIDEDVSCCALLPLSFFEGACMHMMESSVLGEVPEKAASIISCSSSCQFLLTRAHSAISIMHDRGLWGRIVSDSLIKLKENKGPI